MSQSFNCPYCKKSIELTEALRHQFEDEARIKYEKELQNVKRDMWTKAQTAAEEKLREKIENESKEEMKLLKEKLDAARKEELGLRKQKLELEEAKKEMDVTLARRLDQERKKVSEEAYKRAHEEQVLKEREKDKVIDDLKKSLEEAQRKATQGSQQTQGEVLELELEERLRDGFAQDTITGVPKGVNGADIVQEVYDRKGNVAGKIIWESKRTKAWSDGWLSKLKDDKRLVTAELAVLVTQVLPKGITRFGWRDGVWVCDFDSVLGLATALRIQLIHVNAARAGEEGKSEKMEVLYRYLTGTEFTQRIEAIVETFSELKNDLEKEKRIYTKLWAKREKEIERVLTNTIGMHGQLQGIIGKSLPEIKSLALESGTDVELFPISSEE